MADLAPTEAASRLLELYVADGPMITVAQEYQKFAVEHAPAICEALLRTEAALREIDIANTANNHAPTAENRAALARAIIRGYNLLPSAALSPRIPQADGET